jgi:NAD kinase
MKKYENRIVIITRRTRLDSILANQHTLSQARFYLKQLGADFDEYEAEHRQYTGAIQSVRGALDELGNVQMLNRAYLPNFIFAPTDIVVALGQDGLVANTIKYLDGQSLVGINPDPSRYDGVLLPFAPKDAVKIVEETIAGTRKIEEVTMAKVKVQDGQELLAVNDFFIGQKTHTSARYILKYGGYQEPQSSSGIIVSTGLGSTGWMKSVLAGASRISASVIGKPFGGKQESEELTDIDREEMARSFAEKREMASAIMPLASMAVQSLRRLNSSKRSKKVQEYLVREREAADTLELQARIQPRIRKKQEYGPSELSHIVGKWASSELLFAVREPFPSKSTGTNLIFGKVSGAEPLKIESLMGENGVIFSDGIESDFIAFNSGAEAVVTVAEKKGRVVV